MCFASSSLSQCASHIKACLKAGLVPFIQSSPGMGKSAMVKSIAEEHSLCLIDHRLSTSAPEDFTGIPQFKNNKATFTPFDLFPLEGDEIPGEASNGWLLFLDEFNSAPRHIQAAAYKLILDRQVGQHKLHEDVFIVCAGNKQTDRSITNELSTAMTSRLIHISLDVSTEEWLRLVAIPQGYATEVIAYLSAYPDRLMDFDMASQEKTFCCPRTWDFVNRLVKSVGTDEKYLPVYCGAITSGTAMEFIQYCKVFESIPHLKHILSDPEGIKLPEEKYIRFACVASLAQHFNGRNPPETLKLCAFINRFTTDLRILFYRMLVAKNPDLLNSPVILEQVQDILRFFHD